MFQQISLSTIFFTILANFAFAESIRIEPLLHGNFADRLEASAKRVLTDGQQDSDFSASLKELIAISADLDFFAPFLGDKTLLEGIEVPLFEEIARREGIDISNGKAIVPRRPIEGTNEYAELRELERFANLIKSSTVGAAIVWHRLGLVDRDGIILPKHDLDLVLRNLILAGRLGPFVEGVLRFGTRGDRHLVTNSLRKLVSGNDCNPHTMEVAIRLLAEHSEGETGVPFIAELFEKYPIAIADAGNERVLKKVREQYNLSKLLNSVEQNEDQALGAAIVAIRTSEIIQFQAAMVGYLSSHFEKGVFWVQAFSHFKDADPQVKESAKEALRVYLRTTRSSQGRQAASLEIARLGEIRHESLAASVMVGPSHQRKVWVSEPFLKVFADAHEQTAYLALASIVINPSISRVSRYKAAAYLLREARRGRLATATSPEVCDSSPQVKIPILTAAIQVKLDTIGRELCEAVSGAKEEIKPLSDELNAVIKEIGGPKLSEQEREEITKLADQLEEFKQIAEILLKWEKARE